MIKYWQSRNVALFSVGIQIDFRIEELLKMNISEYHMMVFSLVGYNKKMEELAKKKKGK